MAADFLVHTINRVDGAVRVRAQTAGKRYWRSELAGIEGWESHPPQSFNLAPDYLENIRLSRLHSRRWPCEGRRGGGMLTLAENMLGGAGKLCRRPVISFPVVRHCGKRRNHPGLYKAFALRVAGEHGLQGLLVPDAGFEVDVGARAGCIVHSRFIGGPWCWQELRVGCGLMTLDWGTLVFEAGISSTFDLLRSSGRVFLTRGTETKCIVLNLESSPPPPKPDPWGRPSHSESGLGGARAGATGGHHVTPPNMKRVVPKSPDEMQEDAVTRRECEQTSRTEARVLAIWRDFENSLLSTSSSAVCDNMKNVDNDAV
ncbi:hypothetical protein CC1G_13847 [Coprinopsis cinerea okayama7|uniref:Uncharacterized protein n=1 Tax=Coprinopsis cinerea (strain Okayama-7 / 130 / ATCC MYA-4618 / FGSC 9003) TaxID=240176 RepID=D6RKK9_COPC7|nr:hypothetical protein CC1G_13847 [Coprinopsis cinerea okayama7\|eukprot:XP_002911812.1 hypothetical protein CC1G_13847 [Coprinopsis cinerea okayama7\